MRNFALIAAALAAAGCSCARSGAPAADGAADKRTVETYMEAFRHGDHPAILACLTDDVAWDIPPMARISGKAAFDHEVENPAFVGHPTITVTRLTAEAGVVVAEGNVRCAKRDGGELSLRYCDVFEMRDAKIRKLTSYLVVTPSP